MMKKAKCPNCDSTKFLVTAHVTQGLEVDEEGNFLECTNECEEVKHFPNEEDIWTCSKCFSEAIFE